MKGSVEVDELTRDIFEEAWPDTRCGQIEGDGWAALCLMYCVVKVDGKLLVFPAITSQVQLEEIMFSSNLRGKNLTHLYLGRAQFNAWGLGLELLTFRGSKP